MSDGATQMKPVDIYALGKKPGTDTVQGMAVSGMMGKASTSSKGKGDAPKAHEVDGPFGAKKPQS